MSCYVCYESGKPDDPLKSPCKCDGTMKWIHESCLASWLQSSRRIKCAQCNWEYQTDMSVAVPKMESPAFYEYGLSILRQQINRWLIVIAAGIILFYVGWIDTFIMMILLPIYTLAIFISILPIIRGIRVFRECYAIATNLLIDLQVNNSYYYYTFFWWSILIISLMIYPNAPIAFDETNRDKIYWRKYAKSIKNVDK